MRRHVYSTRSAPIYQPVRAQGENEARTPAFGELPSLPRQIAPMYPMLLGKSVNADFDGDPAGLGGERAAAHLRHFQDLNNLEYTARREQLLQYVPVFIVEHDWVAALSPAVKDLCDNEVVLPFPKVNFFFPMLEKPLHAIVSETTGSMAETSLFTIEMPQLQDVNLDSDETQATIELFMKHVRYTLLALELGLVGQVQKKRTDFELDSVIPGFRGDIYKVLPLRLKQSEATEVNVNTGKTQQRFHLKRSHYKWINGVRKRIKWYAAGNIELGIIIKDYSFED